MISPVKPIFVVEGLDDVYVFPSVEEAALWLEPWWVEQKEGSAYDAEGRLLELSIDKYNVRISLGEESPGHASELRSILISFLNAVGEQVGNESNCSLSSLVEICAKRAKTLKSRKWLGLFDR